MINDVLWDRVSSITVRFSNKRIGYTNARILRHASHSCNELHDARDTNDDTYYVCIRYCIVLCTLTRDSQHGSIGRIELQDAQRLVLRPFLQTAVQLELHDRRCRRRSPSQPDRLFPHLHHCSSSYLLILGTIYDRSTFSLPVNGHYRVTTSSTRARPSADIVYTGAMTRARAHVTPSTANCHPSDTCVRADARARRENVTHTFSFIPTSSPVSRHASRTRPGCFGDCLLRDNPAIT